MPDALIAEFGAIEDPCRIEHRLADVLVIAVRAVLGQAESFEDLADCRVAERRAARNLACLRRIALTWPAPTPRWRRA